MTTTNTTTEAPDFDTDVPEIQRAAGIGLFQSGSDDSESEATDTEGIRAAAGIGLFQTGVPRAAPSAAKPEAG